MNNSLGECNQAKNLHEKALIICKRIFSEDHADLASSYNNLADVYHSLGEYNQAKELHEKALTIRKKIFGEDHADVAKSYSNLAYHRLGEYNQAKHLHKKALMTWKRIFGKDHVDLASSYNNLASMSDRLGEYNQAQKFRKSVVFLWLRNERSRKRFSHSRVGVWVRVCEGSLCHVASQSSVVFVAFRHCLPSFCWAFFTIPGFVFFCNIFW